MLSTIKCTSRPAITRPAHPRPIACPVGESRRIVRVTRAQATAGNASPAQLEKFVGCNCWYLLERANSGEAGREYVKRTLHEINKAGFNVIRMWAFYDGPEDGRLQTSAGYLDPNALIQFDWLIKQVEAIPGLKLMMCLTNSLPDLGGMLQYVRWDKHDQNSNDRFEFYKLRGAKELYRNYVATIVDRYKGSPCIHSWDICNEPRNMANAPSDAIAEWVHETAGLVKSLDNRHPVTVGSEGFFGPAAPAKWQRSSADPAETVDWQYKNPYYSSQTSPGNEGCNWLLEAQSDNIDFVCIHPYGNSWLPQGTSTPRQWLDFNKHWIECHMEACSKHLNNKPLVLQEYNMPNWVDQDLKREYHDYVQQTLLADNPLKGAMVWMVAADGTYPVPQDAYTINPACEDWTMLAKMCKVVNEKSLVVV